MDVLEYVQRAAGPALAVDRRGRVLGLNRAAGELLGYQSGAVAGRDFQAVFEPRDVFGNPVGDQHRSFCEMVYRGEPVHGFATSLRQASGSHLRLHVSAVMVLGPDAKSCALVYLLSPLLRRRRADEVIERLLATQNPYTALFPAGSEQDGEKLALTRRELEILALLVQGKNASGIAATLSISVHTVRSHIQNIYSTLNVRSRAEAVSAAYRKHLL